jgi:PPM family protein phosphatase
MRTSSNFTAAGGTHPGVLREVNEDRFHLDETRGLFIVIDGIGGQAAGGKAADIALSMLRERLERETGPIPDRMREAITIANNEIYRLASTRPEWNGMACVLTVAVVKDGIATIGHVGDSRLYKLRDNRIDKLTRDHSPVGEREDSKELSEFEAMRHPRRNEVYRDVGSEPHQPGDPEFADVQEIVFEADAALLVCSDGLTDLVDSVSILQTARQWAGDPQAVVRELIHAANTAGGKDNVTVVYVEGERFGREARIFPVTDSVSRRTQVVRAAITALSLVVVAFTLSRAGVRLPSLQLGTTDRTAPAPVNQIVQSTESIGAAIERAEPGSEIIVEPGEYRERLTLKDNIRLVSRVPRGATIRLPTTASDAQTEPAVIAAGLSNAEFVGFKIVGDAKTPLGVGILVAASAISMVDIEVTGAVTAGIYFASGGRSSLIGSEIHDNPGAAVTILTGASPRITQNVFNRNGMSQHALGTFVIERGASPVFQRNVFLGVMADTFVPFDEAARTKLKSENWFMHSRELPHLRGLVPNPRQRSQ